MTADMQKREGLSGFGLVKVVEPISIQYISPIVLEPKAATPKERQLAIDYILRSNGDYRVILCCVGRIPSRHSQLEEFNFDIGLVSGVNRLSHLPVISDLKLDLSSRFELIVEVHLNPVQFISDAAQLLTMVDFSKIIRNFKVLACCSCVGRKI